MAPQIRTLTNLVSSLLALALVVPATAATVDSTDRLVSPATVVMRLPIAGGTMQRPAVEFNHEAHTTALAAEGCTTCHLVGDTGLIPTLAATAGIEDQGELMDAYHEACMGCHKEREARSATSGPLTCGECHVKYEPGVSQRLAMTFNYSLHARHSLAFEDKCETCHHVYDEATQTLVYVKGREEGCPSCHGASDEDKKPSLRNASHRKCVTCHMKRTDEQLDSGPVLCVGCHDLQHRSSIKQLENVPRLVRGQPDVLWVRAPGGRSKMVPFNHLGHELKSQTCSECHHQNLHKCSECHVIGGIPEGGGVDLSRAFHRTPAASSCVGCHRKQATATGCVGCHTSVSADVKEQTCIICHSGPAATVLDEEKPPPVVHEVSIEPLPATSDDFPDEVNIDVLVDAYEMSKLPHRQIVEKLDASVRESALAKSFHGNVEAMCAGCHHHSPPGTRPPQCRACHTLSAHATRDMPGLKAAYHRQCIGCHQRMGIDKQGCTDCHEEREAQS